MVNVNGGSNQGDAHVIMIDGAVIMIDAGEQRDANKVLIPFLQKLGVNEIQHLYLSHPHRDHYRGIRSLLQNNIEIKNFYYNPPPNTVKDCCYRSAHFEKYLELLSSSGTNITVPEKGDMMGLAENVTLEVVHVQKKDIGLDVNDFSIILKLQAGENSVLFTGDLNRKVGSALVGDARMKATILKMPHHGYSTLPPNKFFDTVSPQYVFVPGQRKRWCGERGAQAREWTTRNKIPTWVNGLHGHVTAKFFSTKLAISSEIEDAKCR